MLYGLGFVYCASTIALAYGLEYFYNLEPCPLCLLQQIVIAALGILFLLGVIFNPQRIYNYLLCGALFIVNGIGIFLAGRQVWLQGLPPELVPSCSAGIARLMEVYPILKVLDMVIAGTGECAKIDFTVFGLSIAKLSVINFILLGFYILYLAKSKKKVDKLIHLF